MDWNKYFEMAVDWKKLPAYKTEPRIDSFIGFFLNSILADYLDVEIEAIIPEFPLRLGTINPEHEGTNYADRSYKVDFLAVSSNGINYLVEFKTDTLSRRDKQDYYLIQSKQLGTKILIEAVLRISQVSDYKLKYNHLKKKMFDLGLLNKEGLYSGKNPDLKIVYIQPSNKMNDDYIISFEWIAKWLEELPEITSFEIEFSKALRKWKDD